jgi:Calmodulin-binding
VYLCVICDMSAVPKRLESGALDYTKKEDFGKVPQYLSQVKRQVQREVIDRFLQQQTGQVPEQADEPLALDEQERAALVQALKRKWEAANGKFQRMSHHVVLDTEGQVRRKEQLERELGQLESDIERLERPGAIFVRK